MNYKEAKEVLTDIISEGCDDPVDLGSTEIEGLKKQKDGEK